MPKPINPTIGRCKCPACATIADVRRLKNHERGRLYLVCGECGTMRPEGAAFQKYVETHMQPLEPAPGPAPEPEQVTPEPAPKQEPTPARVTQGPAQGTPAGIFADWGWK